MIANAAPNPTLSIQTASINTRRASGRAACATRDLDTTIQLDQLIERGGKRKFRERGRIGHLEQASRLD